MNKVLITGANGFIGRYLVTDLISKNIEVIAVVRRLPSEINHSNKLRYVICDLNQMDALPSLITDRDIDVFYHLAWEGTTGALRSDYLLQLNNVNMTMHAANIAHQLSIKRLITTGTISEQLLQLKENEKAISENMVYAISKAYARSLLHAFSKKNNLDYVWAQLGNVYGFGNQTGNIVSYTLQELSQHHSPKYSEALQPYDLVDVHDVIQALYLLGKTEHVQSFYYIGSGKPRILKEYLTIIGQTYDPSIKLGFNERPNDGLIYMKEWFSTQSLEQDTGYHSKYTFEQNIQEIIHRMKAGDN